MKKANATVFVYIAVILLIVVISLSGSYAWFSANVDNDTTYETVITAGDLKLGFENSQYFTVNDMVIIESSEVESSAPKSQFDVRNTGTIDASYDLYFNTTLTNNLISNDFKWELLVDGVSVNTGTFGTITPGSVSPTSASFKVTNEPITLNPNDVNSCVFRVWLQDENYNQISLTEGTMTGNISITAVAK